MKTCMMFSTRINSTGFLITSDRDETVEGFDAHRNKKLDYLPKNIGEQFPNLISLDAAHCSIKEIMKDNFKALNQLLKLKLNGNQIEKIDDDIFDYIPAVKQIWLGK